jgi:hypothetical protein
MFFIYRLSAFRASLFENVNPNKGDRKMTLQEFLTQVGKQENEIFNLSGQDALDAVEQDGFALEYVMAEDQTEAIVNAAIQNNGQALRFVSAQSEAICLAAVNQCGMAIKYVRSQTQAICLAAVEKDPRAILYVDKHVFDPA